MAPPASDSTSGSPADVYDWWSRHPRALGALYTLAFAGRERQFRRRAVATLDLSPGERALELGCGNGNSFEALQAGVAPDGTVVGLDASGGMTAAATERTRDAAWEGVHVVRGDAERPPVPDDSFDAAYAAMSLSAVPDPVAAVEAVYSALAPGGRFVVLDAQPFQWLPLRALNPLLVPVFERTTNWVPGVDLLGTLAESFDDLTVSTFNAGSIVVARAVREPE